MKTIMSGQVETFIHQQHISDLNVCDNLINFFNKSSHKHPGEIGSDHHGNIVVRDVKDSIDVKIRHIPDNIINPYWIQLQNVVDSYIQKFPFCNRFGPWRGVDCQIQYYRPGGGFKEFHCERATKGSPANDRHLVFMTYLNDVTDQGGTEFPIQNLVVQPQKGLTLIWPTDWTHTHRGIVSPTQEKFIITGWFYFS